jgi:hypothetical protein
MPIRAFLAIRRKICLAYNLEAIDFLYCRLHCAREAVFQTPSAGAALLDAQEESSPACGYAAMIGFSNTTVAKSWIPFGIAIDCGLLPSRLQR